LSGYLLDTNIILIALTTPDRLTDGTRQAVLDGPNVLSVISYWEVLMKSMKGSLRVGDPRAWWHDALEQLAATSIPLRPEHIAEVCTLPPIHKHPFDRVLIAQATVEDLDLVTLDSEIPRYASPRTRVVS
jgi:PIN domain nuclease of toxin-antitoxin system